MTYPHITLDHIPDADLRGIGLVNQAWSYFEGALERICWLMAKIQHEALGQALTTHMSHRSRYDAALALVREQFPDSNSVSTLKTLENKITALAGKRNNITHSRLHGLVGVERPFRVVYKARGKVNKETIKVDLAEYDAEAFEIIEITGQVIDILNELVELVLERDGALPDWTRRPQ